MQKMEDETILRGQFDPSTTSVARIELDNGISFTVPMSNLPITIGRAADCDICIPSGMVSRHHCALYLVNGILCLKDTSSNGTLIADRLVKQATVSIQHSTSISFAGEVYIRIVPTRYGTRQDRRRTPRRDTDRRQRVVFVNFDRRRANSDRRTNERRR